MNMIELKTKYDGKPVKDIENSIKSNMDCSADHYRQYIGALFYLERTGKYKESPGFKGADFDRYLRERWNLTPSKYRDARLAYIQFPEASERYGAGFVASISHRCGGQANVPAVLNALKAEERKASKPLPPERRDAVLARFAPSEPIKKDYTDWRAMYLQGEKTIQALRLEMAEKDRQIEKLKRAVAAHKVPPSADMGRAVAATM